MLLSADRHQVSVNVHRNERKTREGMTAGSLPHLAPLPYRQSHTGSQGVCQILPIRGSTASASRWLPVNRTLKLSALVVALRRPRLCKMRIELLFRRSN